MCIVLKTFDRTKARVKMHIILSIKLEIKQENF